MLKLLLHVISPLFFLALIVFSPAPLLAQTSPAQDSSAPAPQSVAEAARNARARTTTTQHPHKVITNEDLVPHPVPPPPDRRFLDSISYAQELPPAPPPTSCDAKPQAAQLKSEIQSAQSDLDALRQQASLPASVISDDDLDPQYFKRGGSGLDLGSPPLLDNQPPIPPRVSAVQVQERIVNLQKLLQAACDPPAAVSLQFQLDSAQQQLDLASRTLALDQADFYGRADFTSDAAGQTRINNEQQQVQDLRTEVDRLQAELAAQLAQSAGK